MLLQAECSATLPSRQPTQHGWKPDLNVAAPSKIEDLAFATVSELASLLHARKITSLALTQMYLARLKRYDSKLAFRHHPH